MKRLLILLLLLLPLPAHAAGVWMYGGMGGWTPASPTGGGALPVHWYSADGTNYQDSAGTILAINDGDVIGKLTDYGSVLSGVSQPTTDNKPTLQVNEKNGRSVWRFDGSNDWMQSGIFTVITQPYTMIVVAQLDSSVVNDNSYRYITDNSVRMVIGQTPTGAPDLWFLNAGTELNASVVSNANWNIWSALCNGASSQFWLNGTSIASGNAGTGTPNGITIGARYSKDSAFWKGNIAEIIIYGSNLSTADKNQLGQYLSSKYGISYTAIP